MDILLAALDLLVQSFWGIVVPFAAWIGQVIVFLVGLIGGGFAVVPLIAEGARRAHRRCLGHWPMEILVWISAVLLGWFWLHLWVAVAIWWEAWVFPHGDASPVSVIALGGCFLSVVGLYFWYLWAVISD